MKTKLNNKSEVDSCIERILNQIDWIFNVGPSYEDEERLRDLEKSIQMIGRILYKTNESVVYENLKKYLDTVMAQTLNQIAEENGVDISNVPDHPSSIQWTPSQHFANNLGDRW